MPGDLCPNCGTWREEGQYHYCPYTTPGYQYQTAPRFFFTTYLPHSQCKRCGQIIDVDDRYCRRCGEKLVGGD